ncbi:MAG: M23 family metallopeptidase [Gemmatimonadetes bacterium]|nr:M23 family metallopeptidase [Gemmatimonadota bacterium]
MNHYGFGSALAIAGLFAAGPLTAQISLPVDVRIPMAPAPFAAAGKIHLVYELHVTNFGRQEMALTGVAAMNAGDRTTLVEYSGEVLAANLRRPGFAPDAADPHKIAGGARAVVFMWVSLDDAGSLPWSLEHRLTFESRDDDGQRVEATVDTEGVEPGPPAVVISAPLRGANWFAFNGPDNVTGHRRALIPVGGRARIAQRFAIDWVQIVDGATHTGDREDNANYHAWGADALAVADGIVVEVKDSIPENVPGIDSRAVPITLETVGGNYVVLDIGDGHYAFYAHLQPGSIVVAPGDRVRRGQVLGLVGNSGNSTEPHLHFHVADAIAPLGSEGVPYVLDRFMLTGRAARTGAPPEMMTPQPRGRELPLANMIVEFR